MTDLLLDPYAHYNASSLVLIFAFSICAVVGTHWMIVMMRHSNAGLLQLFHVRPLRMIMAAVVGFVGIVWGSVMWVPAFPLLISGREALSTWYITWASWPAGLANMLSVVAASMFMWPWLVKNFGRWVVPVVTGVTAIVYIIGLVGSIHVGVTMREWKP